MADATVRPKRTLLAGEKDMLLSLTPDSITLNLLHSFFTDTINSSTGRIVPSQFNTYDEFSLKKGEYFNKEDVTTTIGLFIFNKFLIEGQWEKEIGYINYPLNKKAYGALEDKFAYAILTDETGTATKRFFNYLDRLCWLLFTYHSEICASMTMKTCKPLPKIQARKEQLLKENKEKLDNNDIVTAVKIQEELVKLAQEELKDDPSMELYDSGARGAFDNAYRQDQIMKGPVWNDSRGKFDIVTKSLHEGIEKKDLPAYGNAIVSGVYPKSIGTGECGYLTKKLIAMLQTCTTEPKGTDCGTKTMDDVTLTNDNLKFYIYHYIIEGSKKIVLTPENKDKYIGKMVKMRLPGNCIHDPSTCNICAGERFYMMGIDKIGLTSGRISNSLLRARMKQAHDATVKLSKINADELFFEF